MKKNTLLIPTLSTLFVSSLVLANAVAAEENQATNATTDIVSAGTGTTESSDSNATDSATTSTDNVSDTAGEEESTENDDTAVPAGGPTAYSATGSTVSDTITILHTNDIHGRIEESNGVIGVAKLATVVEETRAQGTTLVLDAGDAFQGMPISNSSKGEDLAAIMNEIGYDAMAVGNHEFDFGLDQAIKYKELLNFPLLSSNVYLDGARLFQASTIIDKDTTVEGDEFVVIGVTTPETATKTHPKNVAGVTFTDPVTEVNTVIAQIEANAKAEGKTYNNYIILAHLGVDATTPVEWQGSTLAEALANNAALAGKNVILIDGHSHTVLKANHGENVTYNQTGSYLNNIGKITLNSTGILSSGIITADEASKVTANSDIAAKVADIKARYDEKNAAVLVESSPVSLNGERENVRVRETNQGNAIADALWEYGQTGFSHKTNVAVMNGGGIRATLAEGEDITIGDVISVLPFGNIISQIEVTGQNIHDMYVKSLGSNLQKDADGNSVLDANGFALLDASGGFLQSAGVKVYYDPSLEPAERVLYIEVYDHDTASYLPLDVNKVYYLATNDFLAAGGDGYTMLGGAREEGVSLDEVYADFLKTADLTKYATVTPNERLIPTKKATFTKPSQDDPTPPNNPKQPSQPTDSDKVKQPALADKQGKSTSADKVQEVEKSGVKVTDQAAVAVPVTYQSSEKSLPRTGSEDSILATLAGFGLITYAFYGMSKKRKTN